MTVEVDIEKEFYGRKQQEKEGRKTQLFNAL